MKYMGTLIAVKNLEKSKKFYRDVLGLKITTEQGPNITFNGCIVLHAMEDWVKAINSDYVMFDNRASEMYFETERFDDILMRLDTFGIEYVHKPMMHHWGQRIVRFYDPDRHIIEVGEAIETVILRFAKAGLTVEEIAAKMKMQPDFIRKVLDRYNGN